MATILNTYRINRLSNNELTLGLKTGYTLSAQKGKLTVSDVIDYAKEIPGTEFTKNSLVNKNYVDEIITRVDEDIKNLLTTRVHPGDRIAITEEKITKDIDISLIPPEEYASLMQKKYFIENKRIIFTGQVDKYKYGDFAASAEEVGAGSGAVITAIYVDKFGAVQKVDYKKISTSDLDNTAGVYDNYKGWIFNAGGKSIAIKSYLDKDSNAKTFGTNFATSTFDFAGEGIGVSYDGNKNRVVFAPSLGADNPDLIVRDGVLTHDNKNITGDALLKIGLYKFQANKTGHIVQTEDVTAADLTSIIPKVGEITTAANSGLVPFKSTANIVSDSTKDTYFFTSDGKWSKIPYNKVNIGINTSDKLSLVGVGSGSDKNIAVLEYSSHANIDKNGNITASSFIGDGSGLNSLDASKITSGTLQTGVLPVIPIDKGGFGKAISSFNNGLVEIQGNNINTIRPIKKGYFLLDNSNTNAGLGFKDINEFLKAYLSDADAMIFKGTIGVGGTVEVVENGSFDINSSISQFQAGWTYKATSKFIITDGPDNTYKVEPGDLITAIKDFDFDGYPKWVVSQGNLDGTVISSSTSSVNNEIAIFDGSKGRVIKSGSGITITDNVIHGVIDKAKALETPITLWGVSFDGSTSIDGEKLTSGNISPKADLTYSIGSPTEKYKNIYSETFTGNTFTGEAAVATLAKKAEHKLLIAGKEYDGSSEIEITLSDLSGISNVLIPEKPQDAGKFVTSITRSVEGGAITLTPNYLDAIVDVNNSLFNKTNVDGTITFTPYDQDKPGALSMVGGILRYSGKYFAQEIYAKNDGIHEEKVLTNIFDSNSSNFTGTKLNSNLLVADYDTKGTAYGFKASNIWVSKSTGNDGMTSDSHIPTNSKVKKYVDETVRLLSDNSLRTIVLSFSLSQNGSDTVIIRKTGDIISSGDQIRRVVVKVDVPKDIESDGIVVKFKGTGSTTENLMTSEENSLSQKGTYINDVYYIATTDGYIEASITKSLTDQVGGLKAYVYIDYSTNSVISQ